VLSIAALGLAGGFAAGSNGAAPPPIPAELLVRFESGASQARALKAAGATVVERLSTPGLVRVRLEEGASPASALQALMRRADVSYAGPNRRYELFVNPNDEFFDGLWGLHQSNDADIDAPAAWDLSTGSDSVTVAVVDTGIEYTHPDLMSNIWLNPSETANLADDDGNGLVDDIRGWDYFGSGSPPVPDNDPRDTDGHGTHVAGTIGARGNNTTGVVGVNWNVKLIPLRVGTEDAGLSEAAIIESFRYACAKGAKVINGSFGASGPNAFSPPISAAIAGCPNALFVFAAGNDGMNNDVHPVHPCGDPAPNVICVAATRADDQRASFSNYGATSVEIAAPGQEINSTYPAMFGSYAFASGTSMATPHVAGVAALVWAFRPSLTASEVRRAILLSADSLPGLSGVVDTGGRINAHSALLQEVVPPTGLSASSPSHGGGWSNNQLVQLSWGGAFDANGIGGYSYGFSPAHDFVPDEVKDADAGTTTLTMPLTDGEHWFHVRARDGEGNWSGTVHVGPIRIDTFQPVRPVASSPSHRVGGASSDRTVAVAWSGATDSASGVDGYSYSWSKGRAANPDLTKNAEETVSRATSARLAVGAWWFNIRARDNAGNWSDAVSLGPFSIRGGPTVCLVPRLRNHTLVGARRLLAKRGCRLGRVTRARSRRVRRGRVIAQRPPPGLRRARGAKVRVVLSRGRR
jgi:subtilisin family serine protease